MEIISYRLYHVNKKIEVEKSMSLPDFKRQAQLFGIYGPAGLELAPEDRYRLFAEKIYPLLVGARPELEKCYCEENGRPSVEPVLVLGVTLLQFVEKVPDREAVERLRYHLGWKYALNYEMNEAVFDSTVLVRFRDKLLAVRSSSLHEDSWTTANAGKFLSLINVPASDTKALTVAIDRVIGSYNGRTEDNQVLVQEMVLAPHLSGVAFTRTLSTGAPYYVVNYDDQSRRTDTVTGGFGKDLKVIGYPLPRGLQKPLPFQQLVLQKWQKCS